MISTVSPSKTNPTTDARRELRVMYEAAGDVDAVRRLEEAEMKEALKAASAWRIVAPYLPVASGVVAVIAIFATSRHHSLSMDDSVHIARTGFAVSLPLMVKAAVSALT
jgi:hypothetical protein